MNRRAAVTILAAALVVPALVQAQSRTEPAFDKLAADWEAAYNAKDAAKLASLYAEDAVYMQPGHPMVKGRANIQALFEREFQGGFTLKLQPIESAIAGAQGFEAGTATATGPGGRSEQSKYVVVYEQVNGTWKIAYDIHNSDAPSPGQ